MKELSTLIGLLKAEYSGGCGRFEGLSEFDEFRSLVNIRRPAPASKELVKLQDQVLQKMLEQKGITDYKDLKPVCKNRYLWQGDITTLRCDAIVNAANSQLLGCFCPCHHCIDNAIHTFAGLQLRQECARIMERQKHGEPVGLSLIHI